MSDCMNLDECGELNQEGWLASVTSDSIVAMSELLIEYPALFSIDNPCADETSWEQHGAYTDA